MCSVSHPASCAALQPLLLSADRAAEAVPGHLSGADRSLHHRDGDGLRFPVSVPCRRRQWPVDCVSPAAVAFELATFYGL
jgi:hypothetical protein